MFFFCLFSAGLLESVLLIFHRPGQHIKRLTLGNVKLEHLFLCEGLIQRLAALFRDDSHPHQVFVVDVFKPTLFSSLGGSIRLSDLYMGHFYLFAHLRLVSMSAPNDANELANLPA